MKYTQIFFIYTDFLLTYISDSSADFCTLCFKRRGFTQECAFWGLTNLKLVFNAFIAKIKKNYNGADGEN